MEYTYNKLMTIVVTQGITRRSDMTPLADFQQDLNYKSVDISELIRLAERNFNVSIPPEDYDQFSTLYDSARYIKEKLEIK
jgi:acyl carrier protein